MKKVLIILAAAALWQCRPDIPEGPVGSSYDLSAGIDGNWEISSVIITDLTLAVPETRDLSDYFTDMPQPLSMSFDTDAGTYTVDNATTPANPFGTGGTYLFNDPEYPSAITFYTIDQDTVEAELTRMVRSIDNTMGYRITKSACDAPYASYDFIFKRK